MGGNTGIKAKCNIIFKSNYEGLLKDLDFCYKYYESNMFCNPRGLFWDSFYYLKLSNQSKFDWANNLITFLKNCKEYKAMYLFY